MPSRKHKDHLEAALCRYVQATKVVLSQNRRSVAEAKRRLENSRKAYFKQASALLLELSASFEGPLQKAVDIKCTKDLWNSYEISMDCGACSNPRYILWETPLVVRLEKLYRERCAAEEGLCEVMHMSLVDPWPMETKTQAIWVLYLVRRVGGLGLDLGEQEYRRYVREFLGSVRCNSPPLGELENALASTP